MTKTKFVVLILLCIENVLKYTIAQRGRGGDEEPSTNGTEAGTCADIVELSSQGHAAEMWKRLIGTYIKQERTLLGWEVYRKSCDDDMWLYRNTDGQANDWLFGRWSGNNVAWIKHLSCGTCPENCPRTWIYLNTSQPQWYYDYSIRVTAKYSEDTMDPSPSYGEAGTCADILELHSESGATQKQKSLMGYYVKQERTVVGWEVYKKSCNDDLYLYRNADENAQDWLFGPWNGNNVGWVKHLRCGRCPENCPRTWVYWDPSRTQWYYDYSIRVTAKDSEDSCSETHQACSNGVSGVSRVACLYLFCTFLVVYFF